MGSTASTASMTSQSGTATTSTGGVTSQGPTGEPSTTSTGETGSSGETSGETTEDSDSVTTGPGETTSEPDTTETTSDSDTTEPTDTGGEGVCGTKCCDITEFGAVTDDGIDDQPAIQAAITAALATDHRFVYIPIGTWDIGSTIDMTSGQPAKVTIAGADSKATRLRWMDNLNYSIFNTHGGHDYFKVDLRTLTIDGRHLEHASGSGHGVRAGNGWEDGHLHMQYLNILHPGFYGVGIQNGDPGDLGALSVWLTDSYVADTGSDGVDFKAPPDANNYDVHIQNVVFHNVGNSVRGLDEQGNGSDAGIDLTADGFGIYRVTIVTDAYKHFDNVWHPLFEKNVSGTNTIQGIRLRKRGNSWAEPAARNGSINRVYIKYPERGVFFEGWNQGVVIERTHIKSVSLDGVYLRGVDNTIKSTVCAVDAGTPLTVSSANGNANMQNNTIDGPVANCIPIEEVGALPENRDQNNLIDVAEPMDCE